MRELKMKLVEKSLKRWRRGKLPLCIAIALCRIAELHESEKKSNKVLLILIIILLLHCMNLSLFLLYKIGWGSKQEEENCSVNNCPEEYERESAKHFIFAQRVSCEKLLLYRIMNRNARSRLLQYSLSLSFHYFSQMYLLPAIINTTSFIYSIWCYCYDTKV